MRRLAGSCLVWLAACTPSAPFAADVADSSLVDAAKVLDSDDVTDDEAGAEAGDLAAAEVLDVPDGSSDAADVPIDSDAGVAVPDASLDAQDADPGLQDADAEPEADQPDLADTPDGLDVPPAVDAKDTSDSADFAPSPVACEAPPPSASLPPMQYAKPAPWQKGGTVTCGKHPPPYFWVDDPVSEPVACTSTCAPLPHADKTVCAGGQCLAARCALGWQDADAWGGNGCEKSTPVVCEVYVDPAASAAAETGSASQPFHCLNKGLAAVQPGCVLHLAAGTYRGFLTIKTPGLVVRGAGPDQSVIVGPNKATFFDFPLPPKAFGSYGTIEVEADGVVLEGLGVSGGRRSGIRAVGSQGVLIRDVHVHDVPTFLPTKFDGANGSTGIEAGADTRVVASTVTQIGSPEWSLTYWNEGNRGVMMGAGARLLGVRVDGVQGVDSCKWKQDCNAGTGGGATGIQTGVDSLASGCEVTGLVGGAGGQLIGYNQTAFMTDPHAPFADGALHPFQGVRTDPTDCVNGQAWLHVAGCVGGTLQGWQRQGPHSGITVSASSAFVVSGNDVADSADTGIRVDGCAGCTVQGNVVHSGFAPGLVIAGAANSIIAGNSVKNVKNREKAAALAVKGCAGCTLVGNVVQGISVGMADNGMLLDEGKSAIGLHIVDAPGAVVTGTTVESVFASGGVPLAGLDPSPNNSAAIGIRIESSPKLELGITQVRKIYAGEPGMMATGLAVHCPIVVHGLAISGLVGGKGLYFDGAPGPSCGISLIGAGPVALEHITVAGASVALSSSGTDTILVRDAILQSVGACPISGKSPFDVAWSDLWPDLPCALNVLLGQGILHADPLFIDPAKQDVHLQTGSPCIDAGDPAAPFCAEPAPNGCRGDMGAYGGTVQATPKPGAKSCACP